MKKLIKFLVLIFLFSCKQENKPISPFQKNIIINKANKLLNNWHKAASKADYEKYFDAMDNTSIFVGTDAKEVWNKKQFQDFSKPYFDKGTVWSFTTVDRNIYISKKGNYLWFDELLDTWMGVCRGSGVIEKVNNNWKIKHYVLSLAIPNESINEIVKIKKQHDSLFLVKFKK